MDPLVLAIIDPKVRALMNTPFTIPPVYRRTTLMKSRPVLILPKGKVGDDSKFTTSAINKFKESIRQILAPESILDIQKRLASVEKRKYSGAEASVAQKRFKNLLSSQSTLDIQTNIRLATPVSFMLKRKSGFSDEYAVAIKKTKYLRQLSSAKSILVDMQKVC
jgi:hypothetical protein